MRQLHQIALLLQPAQQKLQHQQQAVHTVKAGDLPSYWHYC